MKSSMEKNRFTLIEMLVVIAIIGILASLLMPALQSAMDSARMVLCTNNLRQVGMISNRYADEYEGFLTPSGCGEDFIQESNGGKYGDYGSFITFMQGYNAGFDIDGWGSYGYIRNPLFICPSDAVQGRAPTYGDKRGVSYTCDSNVWKYINDRDSVSRFGSSTVASKKQLKVASDIRYPSKTLLLGEAFTWNKVSTDIRVSYIMGPDASSYFAPQDGIMTWGKFASFLQVSHLKETTTNILYFDSHVEPLIYPDWKESLTITWLAKN